MSGGILRAGVWPPTPCAASRRSHLRTESSVRRNRTYRLKKCLLPGGLERMTGFELATLSLAMGFDLLH
jgi:hypothetical protein